jgi:hypothetical protein
MYPGDGAVDLDLDDFAFYHFCLFGDADADAFPECLCEGLCLADV